MANVLITDQHIAAEALMVLENELVFTKQVNRDYQSEYTGPAKRGATIYAKRPPRYNVRDSQTATPQDTLITEVPVTLNHQFGVDVDFSSQELTLSIDGFSEQVLRPAMCQIANSIDLAGLTLAAQSTGNIVGTPGTAPGTGATAQSSLLVYGQAQALLDKNACPRDGNRAIVINEDAQAITVPNLAGLFQPATSIASQYSDGQMGKALGLKFGMSQNVYVPTFGALGGTPVVSGTVTGQTLPNGTTLSATLPTFSVLTSGWTASTLVLNQGDVVYFAGCYLLNPASRQNANKLKGFCVAAPVTSNGSGIATITLTEPMIVAPSPWQNVTTVPAPGASITFASAANVVSPQNIAFHKNAITLACVPLPLPGGVHMAARKGDDQLGLSIRFVAAYNVLTDLFVGRFDILCGWAVLRPEWLVRVAG